MNDLEQRVRQAFDTVEAPEEVKRQTLARIEAARCAAESVPASVADTSATSAESAKPVPQAAPAPARNRFRAASLRRIVALAACLALAVVCLSGYRLYAEPTAYVGIDVNPSIELSVNRFGIVVATSALNEDGRILLEAVPLENRRYADALALLTGSDAFAPYAQEDSLVEISVTSDDEQQAESLRTQSDTELATLPCSSVCAVVDQETHQAASESGMGVARYLAAEELIALDPSLTLQDCATMSMRELRNRIAACNQSSDTETSQGQGSQHGQGSGQGLGHGSGNAAGKGADTGRGNGSGQGQ